MESSNGGDGEIEKLQDTDDEVSNNEDGFVEFLDEKPPPKRTNGSMAWEYFEIKDRKRRVATCRLCSCDCSYWSSVSNLVKHVRRKHGVPLRRADDQRSASPPPTPRPRAALRSTLWHYFKILDVEGKLAVCVACKKQLSFRTTTSNLKKHLRRSHPEVKVEDEPKRVIISSDGQLYEIEETKDESLDDDGEEQPSIDIDSVFIEDFNADVRNGNSRKKKTETRQKKRKKVLIEDTGHSDDTSSDEITFEKKFARKKTDSLDQFGKYIVSLMKQLPKELSNQLQLEFVKQIMTAQLKYDSQNTEAVTGSAYAVTITSTDTQSEHHYVQHDA